MSKKKILLLSDDMRMSSGIATMSKALVMGTLNEYDWFQVGAAIKHPDKGKVLDLSVDMQKRTGVEDASVKILPWNGYGNADLLRQIMNSEKPDAILHFTDPRYWTWLYDMEHEIRETCPILYYTIWDDLPDPLYNRNYIWNTKSEKPVQFFIIQYGMIYQTHYIIEITTKVVIG